VNIVPGVLSLTAALAIALTGNSLPLLHQDPDPVHPVVTCAQIVIGDTPWSCLNVQSRPTCDAPWTFAIMTDGVWQCAGGPGPVILPSPPVSPSPTPTAPPLP
jgi:hypothetical protein